MKIDLNEWTNIDGAVELTGLSERTIYRRLDEKVIRSIKLKKLYNVADLKQLVGKK